MQKYNEFLTILNKLPLLRENKKKEVIENMQLHLQNELENRYNIPLDPLVFGMSASAAVGIGALMSTLPPFQFIGNTLADVGKGITIIFAELGVTFLPLFISLFEKRKFIKKIMKNIFLINTSKKKDIH